MPGAGLVCTVNRGASQCADSMRMARGVRPIAAGMPASDASRRSYTPPICSFIHGQGPPPCEMKYVGRRVSVMGGSLAKDLPGYRFPGGLAPDGARPPC